MTASYNSFDLRKNVVEKIVNRLEAISNLLVSEILRSRFRISTGDTSAFQSSDVDIRSWLQAEVHLGGRLLIWVWVRLLSRWYLISTF
jgi:hypothetical protein